MCKPAWRYDQIRGFFKSNNKIQLAIAIYVILLRNSKLVAKYIPTTHATARSSTMVWSLKTCMQVVLILQLEDRCSILISIGLSYTAPDQGCMQPNSITVLHMVSSNANTVTVKPQSL